MPAPLRFRPPRFAATPEVRWMLLRAFGPVDAPFPGPVDPEGTLALSRRFEVSARVAAQQGRKRLAAELGEEAAAGFSEDRARTTGSGLRLVELTREIAEIAAGLGIPLALLKFAALEASGLPVAVHRPACDVDVLAPAERSRELQDALVAAGFRPSGLPEPEHQLSTLEHPAGGAVEIHRLLPGVRPDGGASATFETLERCGLLLPCGSFPGRCFVPAPEAQAAHILVHGLGQHGWWPASYSLLKMVADLIDLSREALTPRALSWVEADISAAEALAVRRLCERLTAGEDLFTRDDEPEAVLLRHILAGRLDRGYESALRLGLFRAQPSDRPPLLRLARSIAGTVFLTRAQVDAIYGPPRHPLGYLGRQLARPFDLLARLGRSGARSLRLRRG
ncbi:MAG TPA: nucleotidyltransferase family protein [Thermoanaerobaculia bacterium]|nr:nucleotidyltransferase family protein [Thermoanaerobaculia bacterium]